MNLALSEDQLRRVSSVIAARLGLSFPPARWPELRRGLRAVIADLGLDPSRGVDWLCEEELARRELDVLASHLTIGETYFFRERAVFDALERVLLPALVRERGATSRELRIWSAGCCTGEEAYSLAILLYRNIPSLSDWKLTLVATDVNPVFLREAERGVYKEWSFRNVTPELRQGFFDTVGEQRYELSAKIRKLVRFAPLNLADASYPEEFHSFDFIFCRNVLMYFEPPRVSAVLARLELCLAPSGRLVVSATEASQQLSQIFQGEYLGDAVFYKRRDRALLTATAPTAIATKRTAPEPVRAARTRRAASTREAAPAKQRHAARTSAPTLTNAAEPSLADAARIAADEGQLDEALSLCDRALDAEKLEPSLHYLRATILRELERLDEAKAAYARALYLEPEFVLAHFSLGNLALEQGQHERARKHFANVVSLLDAAEPETVLPEAGGLSAARLLEVARALLESRD